MTQVELVEAVKIAVREGVTQAIVETRTDDHTKISLMVQLVEASHKQLEDCQAEARALRADLREIVARSGANSWHEVADIRDEQINELKDQVAELRTEIAALKRDRK